MTVGFSFLLDKQTINHVLVVVMTGDIYTQYVKTKNINVLFENFEFQIQFFYQILL